MKRISTMDLIVDDKRFHCKDIIDILEIDNMPEMVEVTIKCTITKDDYEKLMEEVNYEI